MLVLRGPAPNPDPGPFYAFLIIFAFPEWGPSLNSDVESCQNAKIELQKGSWPGFGPKLPFPDIPKKSFNRDLEGCQNAQNRASKGLLAGILSKRTLSNDFQEDIFYSDLEAPKRLLVRI